MVQPGKTPGIWETGQEVRTVAGAVFIGVNSFTTEENAEVPSFAWARNTASDLARSVLGEQPGTVGYAVVRRDGTTAVFEDP